MSARDGSVTHAMSRDGTVIGSRRTGAGPPLVLVHGTAAAHWSFRFVEPLLAESFSVHAVDRRGRGESGDAPGHDIEREFEDVAAVLEAIEEPAGVFGHSYGATVSVGAALLARNVRRLVLYEPAPGVPVVPEEALERIDAFVGRGDRDAALVAAFRSFGLADGEVEQLRTSPTWSVRLEFAHTVTREVRAEAAYRFDPARLRALARPVLLLLGEASPDWAREGTESLQDALPDCRVAILRGEGHAAILTAPELVAREVTEFLNG